MEPATRHTAFRLLRAVVVAYSLAAAAWYLLVRTPLANWWAVQLLEVFNVWFYLPLPALLLPMLFRRDWRSGAWLALPLVIFGGQYGQLFLPDPSIESGIRFRVMTANVHYGNNQVEAITDLLAREKPDLLAIQELGVGLSGPLADRVRQDYPYQAMYPMKNSRGMGILSRHPIVAEVAPEMKATECNCQQVTLEVEGRAVTILNVHPSPPEIDIRKVGPTVIPSGFSTDLQQKAMLALRHRASLIDTPLLVMGDFNTTDREQPYRILTQIYRDVYREAGWGLGFTFPATRHGLVAPFPVVRIDYIFRDEAWAANLARVTGIPGSDHNGVVADLVLGQ